MATGAVIARIISQYSDKGSKAAQRDIARMGKNIDKSLAKVTKAFALASAAAVAFSIKIGKDAVKGAIEDSKSANVLAQTLRSVTGATDEVIAATEAYLKQAEKVTNLTGEELRSSLNALVVATGDVTAATDLQNVALDVAAGTGKDLQAVTMALVRAQGGNLSSLKKLGVPLDDTIIKNKDLAAAIGVLTDNYGGQAKILGDSDPLLRLQRSYENILETLGYALLPVVVEFTEYLESDVLPAIEEWIILNEDQLQQGLRDTVEIIKDLADRAVDFAKFVRANNELIVGIASVIAGLKGYAIVLGAVTGLRYAAEAASNIAKAVFGVGAAAGGATKKVGPFVKILQGLWKTILLLGKAFMALPGPWKAVILAITAGTAIFSKFKGSADKATKSVQDFATTQRLSTIDQKNAILDGFKVIEKSTQLVQEKAAREARLAKIKANSAAREAKDAAKQLQLDKAIAKFKETAGKKLDAVAGDINDPRQLYAAEALLKRQKDARDADKERIEQLKNEILSLKVRNDLADRYVDILRVIADEKITDKEIQALALGWEMPVEAVKAYLTQFQAVSDGQISDDEIINLAKQWGSTQAQAAQYLDFFYALNDGVLDDSEIEKLKTKWKLTEDQVRMYADFVGIVNDGKLEDAEIIKIQDKWKLTTDQVVDYIKKIGSPVSYSGTLIDPAKAAEIGWLNATAALQRYLDLLKAGTGVIINGGTPANPVVPVVPVIPTTPVVPTTPGGRPEVQTPDGVMPSAQAATVYAIAKAAGDMEAAAKAAAQVNPTTIAAAESGAIGAASIAAQLAKAEQEVANAATLAAFKAKEAADAAAAVQAATSRDYDESFRFRSFTMNNASGLQNTTTAAPVINVTVQGSVTTEQDLVSAVRTGLLQTQYNGNSLLLQAI
jgi:hypothetical protein